MKIEVRRNWHTVFDPLTGQPADSIPHHERQVFIDEERAPVHVEAAILERLDRQGKFDVLEIQAAMASMENKKGAGTMPTP